MQAIVGLSRGISRALVNGVVSRSQNSAEASSGAEADQKLGEGKSDNKTKNLRHCTYDSMTEITE